MRLTPNVHYTLPINFRFGLFYLLSFAIFIQRLTFLFFDFAAAVCTKIYHGYYRSNGHTKLVQTHKHLKVNVNCIQMLDAYLRNGR